jgi:excinuclease ABC subunit C
VFELNCGQDFDPAREEEFLAALPPRPAVFLIEARIAGARPYLARTADLRRRVTGLLARSEQPSRRLNLREIAGRIRYRLTGSPFEQALGVYQLARELFPQRYRGWMRLRPPALLKVKLGSAYPRCYVTRRILPDGAFYFGPFPSRKAADAFHDQFLNFYKIRRCQIKILRDPAFPGCIYSEMKMCLAPCFAGCSDEEYRAEVGRVVEFLSTSGSSLVSSLESERDAASTGLDFERGAALHKKIEKVAAVLRSLPELARQVDQLNAVVLQPAAEEKAVTVYAVRGGVIANPFLLHFGELAAGPRSLEAILREGLGGSATAPVETPLGGRAVDDLADHLSLLARWYYSKPRVGEILFFERDWPYRRIARACSRLLGESGARGSSGKN